MVGGGVCSQSLKVGGSAALILSLGWGPGQGGAEGTASLDSEAGVRVGEPWKQLLALSPSFLPHLLLVLCLLLSHATLATPVSFGTPSCHSSLNTSEPRVCPRSPFTPWP